MRSHGKSSVAIASRLTPDVSPVCELCAQDGGEVLWRDDACRVVLVADADYRGYCRVIWSAHVREMTDLTGDERCHCMDIVFAVEALLRELLRPDKINLASLGNMTPHLHWHVIPRFASDPHFPNPIWGPRERGGRSAEAGALASRLRASLAALSASR